MPQPQGRSAQDQQWSASVRELAEDMPDPQEDELVDVGEGGAARRTLITKSTAGRKPSASCRPASTLMKLLASLKVSRVSLEDMPKLGSRQPVGAARLPHHQRNPMCVRC